MFQGGDLSDRAEVVQAADLPEFDVLQRPDLRQQGEVAGAAELEVQGAQPGQRQQQAQVGQGDGAQGEAGQCRQVGEDVEVCGVSFQVEPAQRGESGQRRQRQPFVGCSQSEVLQVGR